MLNSAIRLKESLHTGKTVTSVGWCEVSAGPVMEVLASRFDMVSVDLQHGFMGYEGALDLLAYSLRLGKPALCRVPEIDSGLIGRLLDAGFLGIVAPMVETGEEAKALVRCTCYPPRGERSYGPIRAGRLYGEEYADRADDGILRIAMVETIKAIENLHEILNVEGIDGIYIGPSDLALSMGLSPKLGLKNPKVKEMVDLIRRKTRESGKVAGIHCRDGLMGRQMGKEGFSMIGLSSDITLLEDGIDYHLRDLAAPAE